MTSTLPSPVAVDEQRSPLPNDLYRFDELLTEQERTIRDRVRSWCDTAVIPVVNDYWTVLSSPSS